MTNLNYPVKRSALASVYRINKKSFREWMRDIGIHHSRTLSPAELRRIITEYELPDGVQIKW